MPSMFSPACSSICPFGHLVRYYEAGALYLLFNVRNVQRINREQWTEKTTTFKWEIQKYLAHSSILFFPSFTPSHMRKEILAVPLQNVIKWDWGPLFLLMVTPLWDDEICSARIKVWSFQKNKISQREGQRVGCKYLPICRLAYSSLDPEMLQISKWFVIFGCSEALLGQRSAL